MQRNKVLNALGFQLCWCACVFGGNNWAIPVVAAFILLHIRLLNPCEWRKILLFAVSGIVADTCLLYAGLTAFPQSGAGVIPLWLMLLWLAFALTLPLSLSFFHQWPKAAALAAAVFAPLSYLTGEKAGAVVISPLGFGVISAYWGLFLFIYFRRSYSC